MLVDSPRFGGRGESLKRKLKSKKSAKICNYAGPVGVGGGKFHFGDSSHERPAPPRHANGISRELFEVEYVEFAELRANSSGNVPERGGKFQLVDTNQQEFSPIGERRNSRP